MYLMWFQGHFNRMLVSPGRFVNREVGHIPKRAALHSVSTVGSVSIPPAMTVPQVLARQCWLGHRVVLAYRLFGSGTQSSYGPTRARSALIGGRHEFPGYFKMRSRGRCGL